jgi:outer membrane protein assembly factor BamA
MDKINKLAALLAVISSLIVFHAVVFGDVVHPLLSPNTGGGNDLLPLAFYSPETKVGAGLTAIHFFRTAAALDEPRLSNMRMTAVFTQSDEVVVSCVPEIYLGEKYLLKGSISYLDYVDKYFGVGDATAANASENYTSRDAILLLNFQRELVKGVYAGLVYHFRDTRIVSVTNDGLPVQEIVPGSSDGVVSGMGVTASFDSRDNNMFPSRGVYCSATLLDYGRQFRSDYEFTKCEIDLRSYFPVFTSHVIALQNYVKFVNGNAPFQDLPMVGGPNMMRGYYLGRFRDRDLAASQAEYRLPLWRRLSCAEFAGVAATEDRFEDLSFKDLKTTYGFGLRYLVDASKKVNARLDFGFADDSSGVYLTLLEAF